MADRYFNDTDFENEWDPFFIFEVQCGAAAAQFADCEGLQGLGEAWLLNASREVRKLRSSKLRLSLCICIVTYVARSLSWDIAMPRSSLIALASQTLPRGASSGGLKSTYWRMLPKPVLPISHATLNPQ